MMQARRRSAGFTLVEILISMVILMVGLLGIMAVFPAAMRSAGRAVEDTYASTIAQSVVDAIRNGLHAGHAHYPDGTAFFIFDHDGIALKSQQAGGSTNQQGITMLEQDRMSGKFRNLSLDLPTSLAALASRDYCILLPLPTDVDAHGRGNAFLYPRNTPGDNLNRVHMDYVQGRDGQKIHVQNVYMLGQGLGKEVGATPATVLLEQRDPYPQYSFAFTVRPARGPDPLAPTPIVSNQAVVPNLYEVVVYVYRNFSPDPQSKFNDPVREFVTFVAE